VTDCTYCGSAVETHDPVFVSEVAGDAAGDNSERVDAGAFCNYACLRAHIDEADLVNGAACRFDPS
jgi:hypothetical protein